MGAQTYAKLTDPTDDGTALKLALVMSFVDRAAVRPRDIAATDIAALQASGVSDADIVRLCELNAFLSYQLRLIAGLRLMNEAAP